jgi:hypothetical protein
MEIKKTKKIHEGYKNYEVLLKSGKINKDFQIFEKYQYFYTSKKGKISLIQFSNNLLLYSPYNWEIYCLEGNLFEDVERFKTQKDAEKRIRGLLE